MILYGNCYNEKRHDFSVSRKSVCNFTLSDQPPPKISTSKKRKTIGPTRNKIKSTHSKTLSKEERWLKIQPNHSSSIVEANLRKNLHCGACGRQVNCKGTLDLKSHRFR